MNILKLNKHYKEYYKDIEHIRSFKINNEKLNQFISNTNNIAYMAIMDDKVVGFAWGYILERLDDESMLYIHSVDTLEAYRNQGIGSALIKAFLDDAKKQNLRNTFLITDKGNIRANQLYQKFTKEFEEDKVLYIIK